MKKICIAILVFLVANHMCIAQTNTTAQVTPGSSYVTTVLTDVYPYQSGLKPKIDYSIHFKMKTGTKFKIVEVRDSGSTILGYVIVPWNFRPDTQKTRLFKRIIDSGKLRLVKLKKTQDSILQKENEVKNAKAALHQDSLQVDTEKKALAAVKQSAAANAQLLFSTAVNIDATKALIKYPEKNSTAKQQLHNFTAVQTKAKAQLSVGNDPPDTLKKQLINSTLKLQLNSSMPINQYAVKYQQAETKISDATRRLKASSDSLEQKRTAYSAISEKLDAIKGRFHTIVGQSDNNGLDTNAYKITKADINDKPDTPASVLSRAALYDKLAYIDLWANDWMFFVSAKDFAANSVSIYPKSYKFTWGFLTLPVKMRFDNNRGGRYDFEQNLNFGLTFGEKHQLVNTDDISLNYLAGLSVVNVPLNNATATVAATSTTAVSTSLGFMLQYNKFQIGAFLGRDFAGSHAYQFNYQGKVWLGFAIGISLFGEGQTTAAAQTQSSNP